MRPCCSCDNAAAAKQRRRSKASLGSFMPHKFESFAVDAANKEINPFDLRGREFVFWGRRLYDFGPGTWKVMNGNPFPEAFPIFRRNCWFFQNLLPTIDGFDRDSPASTRPWHTLAWNDNMSFIFYILKVYYLQRKRNPKEKEKSKGFFDKHCLSAYCCKKVYINLSYPPRRNSRKLKCGSRPLRKIFLHLYISSA